MAQLDAECHYAECFLIVILVVIMLGVEFSIIMLVIDMLSNECLCLAPMTNHTRAYPIEPYLGVPLLG
jgi:hypothetical protein